MKSFFTRERLLLSGLAALSGTLYFLGFAGFGIWPLQFVSFAPLIWALERQRTSPSREISPPGKLWQGSLRKFGRELKLRYGKDFYLGWVTGTVAHVGGYYWLVGMLEDFSGFPLIPCVLIAFLFYAAMGTQVGFFALLYQAGRHRGGHLVLCASLAFVALEVCFPMLFPSYIGASFHNLPRLIQVADLGGPTLLSAIAIASGGATFVLVQGLRKKKLLYHSPLVVTGIVLACVAYGSYRIHEVEERIQKAPSMRIGMVQVNMGIFAKMSEPERGLRRHIEQTLELEKETKLDLVVWPESAYMWTIPEHMDNVKRYVLGPLKTPLVFGGIAEKRKPGQRRLDLYNTAYVTDKEGNILGTYDKTFLLAFGEYLPGGELFPWLYSLSPNSGRFLKGTSLASIPFQDWKLGVHICYEDLLPGFVRSMVQTGNPNILVNVTNDAWFGDTQEPWVHLALAKLRAVEHHLYLVRSTNSGVSAFIDPLGRIRKQSGTYTRENLHDVVHKLGSRTFYSYVGDWPGYLGALYFMFLWVRTLLQQRKQGGG